MPGECLQWLRRIKAVEREYEAARLALDRFQHAVELDATVLNKNGTLEARDIRRASERLEATYFIRLFAEAEAGLRLFWSSFRTTEPPASQLMDGIASSRKIPDDRLAEAHSVREHRNLLVHEGNQATDEMALATARSHLCKYFAFLPLDW
jgi:hypothetical protein